MVNVSVLASSSLDRFSALLYCIFGPKLDLMHEIQFYSVPVIEPLITSSFEGLCN